MRKPTLILSILIILIVITVSSTACSKEETETDTYEEQANIIQRYTTLSCNTELLSFIKVDDNHWDAYPLSVDFDNYKLYMYGKPIITLSDNNGSLYDVLPVQVFNEKIILNRKPEIEPLMEYEVVMNDSQIHNGMCSMTFDPTQEKAIIYKSGDVIGTLSGLDYDGHPVRPIQFFVDDEGRLAILGTLLVDSVPADVEGMLTVTGIAEGEDGEYIIKEFHNLSEMYEMGLSEMQAPMCWNSYASTGRKLFYWREGANIIEIEPYAGSFYVKIPWSKVETDTGVLKSDADGYVAMIDFGTIDSIDIVVVNDMRNGEFGERAIFYDQNGTIIGSVLFNMNKIELYDAEGDMKDNILRSGIEPVPCIIEN